MRNEVSTKIYTAFNHANRVLCNTNQQLRGNVGNLTAQVSLMENHNNELQGEISSFSEQNAELRKNLDLITGVVDSAGSVNEAARTVQEQLLRSLSEMATHQAQISAAAARLDQLEVENGRLEKSNRELSTLVGQLREITTTMRGAQELQARLANLTDVEVASWVQAAMPLVQDIVNARENSQSTN